MNDWNQDNFLERLMAPRHDRGGAKADPCPDPESLCAYAEDRMAEHLRSGIAAHLKKCYACAGLHQRLLDFAKPQVAVPATEWVAAEKRLGNWMDGFLRAATPPPREAAQPTPVRSSAGRSWLWSWKIRWALGASAVLAIAATAFFYLQPSLPLNYARLFKAPAPAPAASQSAAQQSAQTQQAPPIESPVAPGTPNSEPQIARNVIPEPGTGALPAQGDHTPLTATRAPNQHVPIVRTPTPSVAQNGKPTPSFDRWAVPAMAPPAASRNAVVLAPELKQLIAGEVELQIAAEQASAANPQPADAVNGNQALAALDPNQSLFIVSSVLNEQTQDGQQCSLGPGDVLTRTANTPDGDMKVSAVVASSQKDDCAAGSILVVALDDLQETHNDFVQKMDAGLQQLAANQGKKGMPVSPVAGLRANPDGQAEVDTDALNYLQQQQREANSTEDEVNQAAAGITPSAYHRDRIRPGDSELSSSNLEDLAQIYRYQSGEPAELTLVAWSQGSKQSNPRPPQSAPATRAPAPKPPSPPAQRPATANRPTAPAQPHAPANSQSRPTTSKPSAGTRVTQPAAKPTSSRSAASVNKSAAQIGSHGNAAKSAPAGQQPGGPRASSSTRGAGYTRTVNGSTTHYDSAGRKTSLITKSGATAKYTSSGRIASIHTAGGMTINRGPNGQRRVDSVRRDGTRVVNVGRNRGFVEHNFQRNGRSFVTRTYVVGGRSYACVYGRSFYRGFYFNSYVPGYYFAPAFYGWAYNPWATPVNWGWGWGAQPWFGYYGYYFAPYAHYPAPAFWLTDYLIAANLQAAFEAQAEASFSPISERPSPGPAPEPGRNAGSELAFVIIPAISDKWKWDPFSRPRPT